MNTIFEAIDALVTWLTSITTSMFSNALTFASNIAPIFSMGFSVYILLVIWAYQRGDLAESISDFAKRMIGWLIIISLAFNARSYVTWVSYIYNFPEIMVSWFTGKTETLSYVQSLQQHIQQILDLINAYIDGEWGMYAARIIMALVTKLVVIISGTLIAAVTCFFYVITKFCLGLTLMTGPLFIGFMLFPSTRQYGMNWINQCFNYVLTVALYSLVGQITLGFISDKLGTIQQVEFKDLLMICGVMGLMTIFSFIVVLSVPSIANALVGGGAQVSAHGRVLGQAMNFTPTGRIVQAMSKQAQKGANAMGNAAMHPVKTARSAKNAIQSLLFGNRAKAE